MRMARPIDTERLLPPAACAELDRYPLTETEAAPHRGRAARRRRRLVLVRRGRRAARARPPRGDRAAAGRDALRGLEAADDDLPLELVLETGVGCDAHMLCGCGWHAAVERLTSGSSASRGARPRDVRRRSGVDPDDPPTAAAAREAARFLVERVGRAPR